MFCRPVEEGGVGFDYRLQMAIADKWIEVSDVLAQSSLLASLAEARATPFGPAPAATVADLGGGVSACSSPAAD